MIVQCRAQISDKCYDGREIGDSVYADVNPLNPVQAYTEDNTYDPATETVICDACEVRRIQGKPGTPLQEKIKKMFPMDDDAA